jgi:siroheme synthase
VERARAQRKVIRLKSGDPLIFSRAAEEIKALTEADVSFEIIPGVTSAFAAAAAIQCALTSRNSASNVIFSAGHRAQSQSHTQSWRVPLPQREEATRVVYMPGRDLSLIAQQWLDEGLPPDFPCAVVSQASQPVQQHRCTTLAALGNAEPVSAPSLLIAGWALRESSATFQPEEIYASVTV